jgi:peptidoglycan/xylan/chitin deacetylase (PgdA/CDA1 family)
VILPAGRQSLAAALSALLIVFVAGAPGARVGAAPGLVTDPPDVHGPLDILRVGLHQESGVLALTVRLRGVPPVLAMGVPGRALCLRLAPASGAPAAGEVCLRAGPGLGLGYRALSSTGAPRLLDRITGRVLRPDRHTVVLRFHAADAGLQGGPFAWSVRTTWRGGGPCAPAPASPDGCVDLAPDAGDLPGTAPAGPVANCTPAGAEFRASGSRREHEIALTFDDGPGPYTASVLSALERERVPATFFVVGEHVAAHEELLRRMVRDGDAIGDHSFSHRNLARDGGFAGLQIEETKRAIERAADYVPCLFRAPFGDVSPALLQQARTAGMLTVQWDVDPRDWSLPGPRRILTTVRRQARDGSIVLMHDGGGPREQTVEALPAVIRSLRHRGFRLVTIPQLLRLRPPPG